MKRFRMKQRSSESYFSKFAKRRHPRNGMMGMRGGKRI